MKIKKNEEGKLVASCNLFLSDGLVPGYAASDTGTALAL